jgi:hypothetical protein
MVETIPRSYQQPHLQITFPRLLIKRLYKRDSFCNSFICKYKFHFGNAKIPLNLEAINYSLLFITRYKCASIKHN